MKHRKRLAAVALVLAVFFGLGVNAYAEEIPAPTAEETTQVEIEQSTSILEEDTRPPAEDIPATQEQGDGNTPVTVFSLEELNAAVETAKDGDTILIAIPITISADATIGATDKTIILKPSDEYKPYGLFDYSNLDNNNVTLQNLVLDGTQADWQLKTTVVYNQYAAGEKSVWNFENVVFKNLNCTESAVVVRNADAYFENCEFTRNYGVMGGALNIESGCCSEVTSCNFISNKANINGGALYCYGEVVISGCTITDNKAVNEESSLGYGGGVFVGWSGNCNVTSSEIAGNNANYGGGIYCEGLNALVDTRIYGNSAEIGGDDIYCSTNFRMSVGYTDNMNAIFTVESNPVGFFLDDQGKRFDSTANTNMLGKSIDVQSSQIGIIGLKFVFQNDLPSMPETHALVVNTFDDLQIAIANASNGDVIYVSNKMICAESAVIGSPDKIVTLKVADSFISDTLFYLSTDNNQTYTFQNLILSGDQIEGKKVFAIKAPISFSTPENSSIWTFENITFEKFESNGSIVTIPSGVNAAFENCHFENNHGRRSGGIEISENSSAEITNCSFADNQSVGDGAAIRCCGQAVISHSTITGNNGVNDGVVRNGGGILVDMDAFCEVSSSTITGNTADLGGGISCKGTLRLCDTLIYGNTGNLGGSDIRVFGGANITVEYTDSMSAIYAENSPVGFYKDDFENTFNADTNAEFVGETLMLQDNQNNNFGVKFIFEGDLPVTPAPDDTDTQPEETPNPSAPIIPIIPPVIEIEPNPTPEPDNTPEPVLPSQPDNPPEESGEDDTDEIPPSDLDEEESKPTVDEESTTQDTEETLPPVSSTDTVSSDIEKAEPDNPPVQEKTDDEPTVDISAPVIDNHIETVELAPPVDNEIPTETTEPEQEEHPVTVAVDDNEEKSAHWGIIITAVTLLSASGAVWLIKRKR